MATAIAALPLNRLTRVGWWFTSRTRRAQLQAAANAIGTGVPALATAVEVAVAPLANAAPLSANAAQARFEADAASFYAQFEALELAGTAPTAVATDPFASLATPANAADPLRELIQRITATDYLNPLLTANLRGWQAFGVRYALTQSRVLLGDEMGLGKTLEALGVITATLSGGATHALVVTPISTLTNWRREVTKFTTLTPFVLRGEQRDAQLAAWQAGGGLAIVNYEQVARMRDLVHLDVLVADEAQALTNPKALRTRAVTALAARATTVLYMTGTPIQNQLQDMLNLITPLQPAISAAVADAPQLLDEVAFKRLVAPVYLRRNRLDVLKELPPLTRQDVWLGTSRVEEAAYREAVTAGDFMAMRQAAWQLDEPLAASPKRSWLVNLVQEARANGHKVLIFSYFRAVLTILTQDLGEALLPTLTGDMPAAARQTVIDEFQNGQAQALAAQINTVGLGVNLQAADIVVFCEPQLNPASEEQALSRAYRMGQTRPVTCYRLLTTRAVDALIAARGKQKRAVAARYAQPSAVAESTPDATAKTSSALLSQLVSAEQARLAQRPTEDWDVF